MFTSELGDKLVGYTCVFIIGFLVAGTYFGAL